MEYLFDLSLRFFAFVRDSLVPFFTEPVGSLNIAYYNFVDAELQYFPVDWPFGDSSFGEFILIGGLITFLSIRLIKFFTDILF